MTEYQSTDIIVKKSKGPPPKMKWRALVAYWILGLCNNFGYVVMLTAAGDIIKENNNSSKIPERNCQIMSTGVILLADIVPCLLVKFLAPFLPFYVHLRVGMCIAFASSGFLLVAFSTANWSSILGVVLTSFCSGLGEVTFLQYSSFYDKNVVSTWSSGTGGAGIVGSLSYSILQTLGFQKTLLIMLIIPVAMGLCFWVLLPEPSDYQAVTIFEVERGVTVQEMKHPRMSFKKKLQMLPQLLKYMIPLGLVYLFEYFINQGTFELVNFDNVYISKDINLTQADQYRWLQVDYQIGVFLSRSSVNLFHVSHIWVFAVFQAINVIIFTTEVIYMYMSSFWIIVALTLWEGMLGGAAYVNTFYKISSELEEENKEFAMGTTSFADTVGITLAGFIAIFAHNEICTIPIPKRP